jgi:hypothetical protein
MLREVKRVELNGGQWRARLSASGAPSGADPARFEILAINAGSGNGWNFSAGTLRRSLALWEGVETFVDHAGWLESGRSLRDLAGVCNQASFDEEQQGVRLTLRTSGPSGPLLEALGREWLASPEPRPRIGFSADVIFTAKGREVQEILRVLSLDVVFNPARGGSFLRALNQINEEADMAEAFVAPPSGSGGNRNQEPGAEATAQEEGARLGATQNQEMHAFAELRQHTCACLLEAGLAAAKLPPAMLERVRRQFAGRIYEPAELNAAIEDARRLTADLQAGGTIRSAPAVVGAMTSSEERLQAAVDDLLGAPRDAGMQGRSVERLSGIRELYLSLTGDVDLHGGYYPARASFATSVTMPALVKNALNKIIVQQWEELGRAGYRWWEAVVSVEHFTSLQSVTGILVGEVNSLPSIDESDPYPELTIADSSETGTWAKYGGYLPLTLELIDRDDVTRLRAYPRKLANTSLRTISSLVASIFTANGGTGPVMADGTNVFDASRQNLGVTALSADAWEAASAAIYNQSMLAQGGAGAPKLALDARYLLVPRALRLTGWRILYPSFEREANIFSENLQRGEQGDVVTVPDWSDATDWAAVADPRLAPAIIIAERFGLKPEIFIAGDEYSPAMFTNDETRLKIRHFLSIFVADYRPLFKANVP